MGGLTGVEAVKGVVLLRGKFEAARNNPAHKLRVLKFFQDYTGRIEIVRQQHKEIVYFPILPYAETLTEQQRSDAMAGMPLGQAKAKLDYFMGNCPNMLQGMKNEYLFTKTFRSYPVFGAVAKHLKLWETLAFYTVI